MKRRRIVQLTALGGLTLPLAGCTDEAADDGNETANSTDTETETSADEDGDEQGDEDDESADEPEDQEFSGSGDDTIEDVTIDGGLTVVDATYEGDGDDSDGDSGDEDDGDDEGESEFEVRLIPEERLGEGDDGEDGDDTDDGADTETEQNATDEDAHDADEDGENADEESDGEAESVLFVKSEFVDSAGEYEGQTAHPVDEGTYVLSVVADGDWEVTVSQPRDESGDELPISIDGSGNEVHGPFEFDGSHQPSGEYDGERIVANVYSPTGDTRFVFNENSIANPSEFEFEGVGYLSVKSDDGWTVELE